MAEVEAVPSNGLKVVSTFSGAGGSCLGYRMAGFDVVWANDFHPNAIETYRLNHSSTRVDPRNIREVKPSEILDAIGMKAGEIDLLDGSPPCQSFSTAGSREKKWGTLSNYSDGTKQRNDDLFFEYTRLLRELQPKVFIAENVSGLVKGVAKGYFVEIFRDLESCGYVVEAKVLDAQWLGVPQTRQRVIFMGVRNDLGFRPRFPEPFPYRYGVADACPWLGKARTHGPLSNAARDRGSSDREASDPVACVTAKPRAGGVEIQMIVGNDAFEPKFGSTAGPTPTLCATLGRTSGAILTSDVDQGKPPTDLGVDDVDRQIMPITESLRKKWSALRIGQRALRKDGTSSDLTRSSPAMPVKTITTMNDANISQPLPPFEGRRFTIIEAKRLCSFPDDFRLLGSYDDRWARLGNSVPPLMMRAVAREVAAMLARPDRGD